MATSSRESAAADKLCSGVTETFHTLANEPSIGLYYVVEHIQRSVPALAADKAVLAHATEQMRGAGLDARYALEDMTAATDGGTLTALSNVAHMARKATEIVRYNNARRR